MVLRPVICACQHKIGEDFNELLLRPKNLSYLGEFVQLSQQINKAFRRIGEGSDERSDTMSAEHCNHHFVLLRYLILCISAVNRPNNTRPTVIPINIISCGRIFQLTGTKSVGIC
jgi:hypothetical protein